MFSLFFYYFHYKKNIFFPKSRYKLIVVQSTRGGLEGEGERGEGRRERGEGEPALTFGGRPEISPPTRRPRGSII